MSASNNPYVGPRPFEVGEESRFFGRDRDLEKLINLLIARRLVLLYAPSGAGKTSLIQAALIPRLRAEGFTVRTPIRVAAQVPSEVASFTPNRYLMAVLAALEKDLPPEQHAAPQDLAQLTLRSYFDQRQGDGTTDEVLIFDQFEELLSADVSDWPAKQAFLADLGAALEDTRRWALFAIREDYLGQLRPLLVPLPTRLDALLRLDLLSPTQARQAVQTPASVGGMPFSDEAASKLIDDLRRTSVQRPDGTSELVLGQQIEPMHIQVVCYRLWERLHARADGQGGQQATISVADVQAVGDVDSALSAHYAQQVAQIAADSGAERQIRAWVEAQLITASGLRNQILRGPDVTGGLANTLIQALVATHLLRAEERRGATWYELAHDRLIAPILEDNAAWRERHLSLLQRQASLWAQQGRPAALLLSGETLASEEAQVGQDTVALVQVEEEFLTACRTARDAAERAARELAAERARAARERIGLYLISALALIILALALLANSLRVAADTSASQARTAEAGEAARAAEAQTAQAHAEASASQARTAEADTKSAARTMRANELAARSQLASPQLALILAAAAAHVRLDAGEPVPLAATQALIDALHFVGGRGLSVPGTSISAYALSPDGRHLAVGTAAGELRIYDPYAASLAEPLITLPSVSSAKVTALAFSPDGQSLAVGLFNAAAAVYRLDDLSAPPQVRGLGSSDSGPIAVAFGADGSQLLLLGDPGIWLADPTALQRAEPLADALRISAAALSPERRWLAVAYQGGPIRLWDLSADPLGPASVLVGPGDTTFALAFSPDGRWLVGAGLDRQVRRWDLRTDDPSASVALLGEHEQAVNALAFSPDGQWVASASDDTSVRLWPVEQPGAEPQLLAAHSAVVQALAFSPTGRYLASAGNDATVRLWDLAVDPPTVQTLRGHEGPVAGLAFTTGGDLLISRSDDQIRRSDDQIRGSNDGTLRLWDLAQPAPALPLALGMRNCVDTGGASTLALSPDGRTLAAGTDAGGAIFDLAAADPAAPLHCLPASEAIMQLGFGGDGRWLVVGSYSPTLGSQVSLLDLHDSASAARTLGEGNRFALSADGVWLVLSGQGGSIQLYDLRADPAGGPEWRADLSAGLVNGLALAPDGRWLALASVDGTQLWDRQSPAKPARVLAPSGPGFAPQALAFSPDGRWLLVGENAGALLAWDLSVPDAPPHMLARDADAGEVAALAFSPDGRWLAAGYQGSATIFVRRVGTDGFADAVGAPIEGTDSPALLAFSPDGHWLLSGSRIWDLEVRGAPLVLGNVLGNVQAAAAGFSADGHSAIMATRDGQVGIWDLRPAILADLACSTAGRALTPRERDTYFADQPDQPDPCLATP